MRLWYADVGFALALLSLWYLFHGNTLFPTGAIVAIFMMACFVASIIYTVLWVGLVRGVYAILIGFAGLLLFGVGIWRAQEGFSVFFGLAMVAGSLLSSIVWVIRRMSSKN